MRRPGNAVPFTSDGIADALLAHGTNRSRRPLGLSTLARIGQVASTHALSGWRRARARIWSNLISSTIPARTASGPSPPSSMFPTILQRNGSIPAIVYVHGGPTGQTVNSFNRFIQYMANQGYMVIAPNYRGSTGYGKEFQQANLFDMGGGDLQDVIAAADWIKQTGYVDPKKVMLMGGSYGGYLTMMGVTKAPEVWAAGVPIVPFVNWFTEIAERRSGASAIRSRDHGRSGEEQGAYRRPLAD